MADDDETTGGDEDQRGLPPHDAKKDAKKKHRDNMILIGVAIVGVILTFLIYRSRQSSSTSTTATTSPPVSGTVAGGTGGDPYTQQALGSITNALGQQTSALQGISSLLTTLQSEVGQNVQASPPPSSSPAPVAAAPPATPGYGYINLPGIGQSVILGYLGQGSYTGYEVGGGAPVYFGNAAGVSQGSAQETAGDYAYTPVQYAPLVSSSAAAGGPLPGQH